MIKSEKQKMLDGELYQAFDPELLAERNAAKQLCFELNQTSPLDTAARQAIVTKLIPSSRDAWIESPFYCDYGYNLQVGKNFYVNHGCTILDCNVIRIGDNCLIAPGVCISAATHPLQGHLRARGDEFTAPITIGDNVWIGANATICPGIVIGNNVVVGAGAVVTKSMPDNVVCGGVPAKILKRIEDTSNERETTKR